MKIIQTSLKGVFIIEPDVFGDERGFFLETYNQKRYQKFDIPSIFVQDNLSFSAKNTLRGLHYQIKNPQAKLVQVIAGEVFDVAVDLRPDSETLGKWVGVHLSDKYRRQVYIPEGFAHGFCVLSQSALFMYKCSNFYDPDDEGGQWPRGRRSRGPTRRGNLRSSWGAGCNATSHGPSPCPGWRRWL